MNKILLVSLVLLSSCKSTTPAAGDITSVSNFDWLLGHWQRSNEKEGLETFEHWSKVDSSEYRGLGFTLQGRDTIWQESIKLIEEEAGWEFQVSVNGDSRPTVFTLTHMGPQEFSCENAENEFPKLIRYFKKGEQLQAVISGGDMEIPFVFIKRNP